MRKFYLLLIAVLCFSSIKAQNNLLMYEPFDTLISSDIALSGFNGMNDLGMSGNWAVQNSDASIPGYNISKTTPLSYKKLNTIGAYAIGGDNWQGCDHAFNVTAGGPFNPYLVGGKIGKDATTLWISVLIRKNENNDNSTMLRFKDGSSTWGGGTEFEIGYFGGSSNNAGSRYWSYQIGGTVYRSDSVLTVNKEALLILRIDFNAATNSNVFRFYVNPVSMGGAAPATPTLQTAAVAGSMVFTYMGYYTTNFTGMALDEIRIGESFASVTPLGNNTLTINKNILYSPDTSGLTEQVSIFSNTYYTISKTASWYSVSATNGLNNMTLNVNINQQNLTGFLRTDTIIIADTTSGSTKAPIKKIAVNQFPQQNFILNYNIKNGSGINVVGARIVFNGEVKLTDASGNATFNALAGAYSSYDISAVDFAHSTGLLQVNSNITQNLNLTPLAGNSLTVFVHDKDNVPISGATISFNGSSKLSGSDGKYLFTGLGTITNDLTITKFLYGSYLQRIFVRIDTVVDAEINYITQTVHFSVIDDNNNPLPNAIVTLGTRKDTTDASGIATLELPAGNNYFATVTKLGYISSNTDTFNVTNTDVYVSSTKLTLIRYNVTFHVRDISNSPISIATVKLGNQSLVTNISGDVIFKNVAPANGIAYLVTKTALTSVSGTIDLTNKDTSKTVVLYTKMHNITFTILDTSNKPVNQAILIFDGDSVLTDSTGIVIFDSIPENTTKFYKVIKPGMKSDPASVKMDTSDVAVTIKLKIPVFSANYNIQDTAGNILRGATLMFDGIKYTSDGNGNIIISNLRYKLGIPLILTKKGYDTLSTTVSLIDVDIIDTLVLTLISPTYSITFNITDAANAPISAVSIFMNYETKITNVSGVVTFTGLVADKYYAAISKAGYVPTPDTIAVIDANVIKNYKLLSSDTAFKVTFTVLSDDSIPLVNSNIFFNSTPMFTDSLGMAVFDSIPPSFNYDYVCIKNGYSYENGKIDVLTTNIDKKIYLTLLRFDATLMVLDEYSKPLPVANVIIGIDTMKTDSSGILQMNNYAPGKYKFRVEKDAYVTLNDSFTIVNIDLVKTVITSLKRYSITFTITDGTNPLSGAIVDFDSTGFGLTNGLGIITFNRILPDSTISYSVTKSGYKKVSGSISVVNSSFTMTLIMAPETYNVTFKITNKKTGKPLTGVTVSFNGGSSTTDSAGIAMFSNLSQAYALKYFVSKQSYSTAGGSFDLSKDTVLQFALDSIIIFQNVYITVVDGKLKPIKDAEVIFAGDTALSDINGKVTFKVGKNTVSSIITSKKYFSLYTSPTSLTITGDISRQVKMSLQKFNLSYKVISEDSSAIKGASVIMTVPNSPNEVRTTDSTGIVVFQRTVDTLDYTFKYKHVVFVDTTDVVADSTILIKLVFRSVTVTLIDSVSQPIVGAKVGLDNQIILTDSTGKAVFDSVLITGAATDLIVWKDTLFESIIVNIISDTTFSFVGLNKVGVEENKEISIDVYPVPATESITIISDGSVIRIELFEMSGRKVISRNISEDKTILNVSNLATGIYLLNIFTKDGESIVKKIIKK